MTKKPFFSTALQWLKQPKRLRDYTPKGLFGRSLLIIALPVALMQIAILWMFFDSQWETVTTRLSEGVAGDVAVIVAQLDADPSAQNMLDWKQLAIDNMQLSVALIPDETLPLGIRASMFSVLDRTLRNALDAKLDAPFWFDTTRYPAYVDIRVQTKAGLLRIIAPRDKVFSTTGHIFVFWLIAATFIQTSIAVIFIRNQVKPIQRLAEAANQFGRGQGNTEISPSGAREIRQATTDFIKMRNRIQRFVEQRTAMLAGVSHDLRTPLTRLKLQFALLDNTPELAAAQQDVREMERMLDGYLSFARNEADEESVAVNLSQLLQNCILNAGRSGANIAAEIEDDLLVWGRADALNRAVNNVLDNAQRYAKQAQLCASRKGDAGTGIINLTIDDDGPGIDPGDYDAAFKPFNRLDPARNLNTDGVGLGLAIARDTIRAHGGDITLERADKGGLRVIIRLPEKT